MALVAPSLVFHFPFVLLSNLFRRRRSGNEPLRLDVISLLHVLYHPNSDRSIVCSSGKLRRLCRDLPNAST